MRIKLGYACISKTLDITSSSTITFTNYSKINDENKLKEVYKKNLENLEKILDYNIKNKINFFRLTSKLVPLATHPEVNFNYIDGYDENFQKIKKKIKNMRVDFHPDQFTVLNSVNQEVINRSIENLEYHYKLLEVLSIQEKIILIHIGSSVFGKKQSIIRFINTFNKLPKKIQNSLAIENDDKIYTMKDTIELCEKINIPMILDYHHHVCNNNGESVLEYLPRIYKTWESKGIKPKMHYSSSKSKQKKEFRTHHDYINVDEFIKFLEILKKENKDVDIMLEAKAKDEALFRLVRLLKYNNYEFEDNDIII